MNLQTFKNKPAQWLILAGRTTFFYLICEDEVIYKTKFSDTALRFERENKNFFSNIKPSMETHMEICRDCDGIKDRDSKLIEWGGIVQARKKTKYHKEIEKKSVFMNGEQLTLMEK